MGHPLRCRVWHAAAADWKAMQTHTDIKHVCQEDF